MFKGIFIVSFFVFLFIIFRIDYIEFTLARDRNPDGYKKYKDWISENSFFDYICLCFVCMVFSFVLCGLIYFIGYIISSFDYILLVIKNSFIGINEFFDELDADFFNMFK